MPFWKGGDFRYWPHSLNGILLLHFSSMIGTGIFPLCKVWMLSCKAFKDVNSKLPVPFDHKNLKFKDICVWPPCKIKTRQDGQCTHWLNMPISKTIINCGFQVFNKKGNQVIYMKRVSWWQTTTVSMNVIECHDPTISVPIQPLHLLFCAHRWRLCWDRHFLNHCGFRLEIDSNQNCWKEAQLVA